MKKGNQNGCLCTPAGGRTLDTLIKSQVREKVLLALTSPLMIESPTSAMA